jgi:hypothetical protein
VDVVIDMVAVVPHVPQDLPKVLDKVASPGVAGTSAFEFFVIRRLNFDPMVGDATLEEVVPSYVCLFSVGGG